MNTIVEMLFGSHLYGTNTPQSDQDFKGVFMPTAREIALMDELEVLTAKSTLPEKVDRNYWDNWLVNVLRENRLV